MSQTSREQQKENALILRNETRKGKNTKVRVYNLINDLVDSTLMYDQIVQSGGTGTTTIMSQDAVTSLLNDKLDKSSTGNTGFIKSNQFSTNVNSLLGNQEVVGQGTVTLTNGSNVVVGNGTNFRDATIGTGMYYWWAFHVVDSSNNIYKIYLATIPNNTSATIDKSYNETDILNGSVVNDGSTTFQGVSGTYSYSIVKNYSKGLFATAFGNNSFAQNYSVAFGGNVIAKGQTSFATGSHTVASGDQAMSMGASTNASGARSFAGGWGSVNSQGDRRVLAAGQTSFNFSQCLSTQTVGHGALATASAILGGENHNIPSNASYSAIIGGQAIKVSSGVVNTVHLPKVRFGLGTNASVTTDNTNDNILVRDASTGEIKIREASSIGSVGSFWKTTGTTSLDGSGTVLIQTKQVGDSINLITKQELTLSTESSATIGVAQSTNVSNRGYSFIGTVNGDVSQWVYLYADFHGETGLGASGLYVQDNRLTPRGIEYLTDYSSSFAKHSLVDVNYVTGITSSLSTNQVGLDLITDDSFTATTTSHYIHYSGSTAGNIYLPVSPKDRQQIVVSDAKGNAFTNNITVYGNGKTINGNTTALIDSNYGTLLFIYNGFNWIGSGFIS